MTHSADDEMYVCILSHRVGDTILFTHEGGVDVGDVDQKAKKLEVALEKRPSMKQVTDTLLTHLHPDKKE